MHNNANAGSFQLKYDRYFSNKDGLLIIIIIILKYKDLLSSQYKLWKKMF